MPLSKHEGSQLERSILLPLYFSIESLLLQIFQSLPMKRFGQLTSKIILKRFQTQDASGNFGGFSPRKYPEYLVLRLRSSLAHCARFIARKENKTKNPPN